MFGRRVDGQMEKGAAEGVVEVQRWNKVRGPAGAVLCETRDHGTPRPQWHTLLFEGKVAVDMRVLCPQGRICF